MSSPFSAVLLAGGKSSRMGRDKAFLEIDGVPLWRRHVHLLRSLGPDELFIAGPPHRAWSDEGCIVIRDAQPDCGPLGGVVSALRRSSTSLLLVLAIDLPRMTPAYLSGLLETSTGRCGVVPRGQPLAGIYPAGALAPAESGLAGDALSMRGFVERCLAQQLVRLKKIMPAEKHLFTNLNTPRDLTFERDAPSPACK